MTKKAFMVLLSILVLSSTFSYAIKQFQPKINSTSRLEDFPLQKDGWTGQREKVASFVVDMLKPEEILSATYTNEAGIKINLLFDYFSPQKGGGPHSPRNCLPGSGWVINKVEKREIISGDRRINAGRFYLRFSNSKLVMDFWYITRYGETHNDYIYKLYLMIGSLSFKLTDVAFIRIITNNDTESLQALDEFEEMFVEEIYNHLPFDQ